MANKIPFKPINTIPSKPTTEHKKPRSLANKKITEPQQKATPTPITKTAISNKQIKEQARTASKSKATVKSLRTKLAMPLEITAQPSKSTLKNKPDVVASKIKSRVNELRTKSATPTKSAVQEKELIKQTKSKPQINLRKNLNITKSELIPKTLSKAVTTKKTSPQKKEQLKNKITNKQTAIQNQRRFNNSFVNKTIADKLVEDTISPLRKSKITLITNYILLTEKYEMEFSHLLFHKINHLYDQVYNIFGSENITSFAQNLTENLNRISDLLNKPSAEVFQIIHELLTYLDLDNSKQLSNQLLHQFTWSEFSEAAKANQESCKVFLNKYFHNFFQNQNKAI